MAAPSANRFGRVSPTTAADVVADLGDAVDLVLDGGPCAGRCRVHHRRPDRPGAGGAAARRRRPRPAGRGARPRARAAPGPGARALGPGRPACSPPTTRPLREWSCWPTRRPSPRSSPSWSLGTRAGSACSPPGSPTGSPAEVIELEPAGGPEEYARLLYARLRQADRLRMAWLVCVPPPARGVGVAVHDRARPGRPRRGSALHRDLAGVPPGGPVGLRRGHVGRLHLAGAVGGPHPQRVAARRSPPTGRPTGARWRRTSRARARRSATAPSSTWTSTARDAPARGPRHARPPRRCRARAAPPSGARRSATGS